MKATGDRCQLLGRTIGLFAVLVLLVPARALADDLTTGAAGTASGSVDEATTEVTEAAGTASGSVDELADEAGNTTTIGQTEVSNAADGFPSMATAPLSGTGDGATSTSTVVAWQVPQSEENGSVGTHPRRRPGGLGLIRSSVSELFSGLIRSSVSELITVNGLNRTTGSGVMDEDDPCVDDTEGACLGLLYGWGEIVRRGADVLGLVATTGIGVIGMMVLALSLGVTGWGALLAARRSAIAAASSAG